MDMWVLENDSATPSKIKEVGNAAILNMIQGNSNYCEKKDGISLATSKCLLFSWTKN